MAGLGAAGGSGLFSGPSLAVLGAGLLAGAVGGGALVATGTVDISRAGSGGGTASGGPGLELLPCPGQGPVIGSIPRNQQVLVTGRSADGGWLQLYWPAPGIESAWTKAGPLQLEGDAASLPVAACEAPPTPSPRPTVEPTASPTASPTPTPTAPPTPSPSPAANQAPKLSGLAASTASISFDQGSYCANAPKSVTISVNASDADGLASVTLRYKPPGASSYLEKAMTLSGGRYSATLDTTADNLKKAGSLLYYVRARDNADNQKSSRIPKSSASLSVKVCKNTGPQITRLTATPNSIIANPLGTSCAGSTLSEFQAQANDPDGVASIELFFKKPGASTYTSRPFNQDGSTWYSFINTVSSVDNIVRSGNISWYVVATDGKGAKTKTATKTMKVTRCDSEASFDTGGITGAVYNHSGCSPNFLTVPIYAQDADAGYPSDKLKVTVTWTATNNRGPGAGTYSGKTKAVFQKGNYFETRISVIGWQNPGSWTLTYFATSTDPFGGTTKSFTANDTFNLYAACVIY